MLYPRKARLVPLGRRVFVVIFILGMARLLYGSNVFSLLEKPEDAVIPVLPLDVSPYGFKVPPPMMYGLYGDNDASWMYAHMDSAQSTLMPVNLTVPYAAPALDFCSNPLETLNTTSVLECAIVNQTSNYAGPVPRLAALVCLSTDPSELRCNVLVNATYPHCYPLYIAMLGTALLRNRTGNPHATIEVVNSPLPLTVEEEREQFDGLQHGDVFCVVSTILLTLHVVSIAYSVGQDDAARTQLVLSSIPRVVVWLLTLLRDTVHFLPFYGSIFLLTVGMQGDELHHDPAAHGLLLLYGAAVSSQCYLLQQLARRTKHVVQIVLFVQFVSVISVIASRVMQDSSSNCKYEHGASWLLRLLPTYALGRGLLVANRSQKWASVLANCGFGQYSFFSNSAPLAAAGLDMVYLAVGIVWQLTATVVLDKLRSSPKAGGVIPRLRVARFVGGARGRRRTTPKPLNREASSVIDGLIGDDEVVREVERVRRLETAHDLVMARDVSLFTAGVDGAQTTTVLNRVSFAVKRGERLCVFGSEAGSGRSVLLSVLAGLRQPSDGAVSLLGVDSKQVLRGMTLGTTNMQRDKVHASVGYCPAVNCFLSTLTVRENISFMASLRGLPHPDAEATRLLTLFGLTQQQHVLAGTLNAPCGRKLSVALATIGSPSVLILDAPTYCLDPEDRQLVWDALAHMKSTAMIVGTESLEECSSLSTRMCVLVDGHLEAMGTKESLLQRYGHSYTIELRVRPEAGLLDSTEADLVDLSTPLDVAVGGPEGASALDATSRRLAPGDGGISTMHTASFVEVQPDCESCEVLVIESSRLAEALRRLCGRHRMVDDGVGGLLATMTAEIHPSRSGWLVHNSIQQRGYVLVSDLVEWFHLVQQAVQLDSYFSSTFEGVNHVFHQGERHRFRVSRSTTEHKIFSSLEANKLRLGVVQYTVSQTSLDNVMDIISRRSGTTASTATVAKPLLITGLTSSDSVPLPRDWAPQEGNCLVVDVVVDSAEWRTVANRFHDSLKKSSYHVIRIQRVQNVILWRRYQAEKQFIAAVNGPDSVNERKLFHGTGRLPPEVIYSGTVGFDPRCTREGNFYGRGVYFAEKASYVEGRYAHEAGGRYCLFLADVILGRVKDFGTEKAEELSRPPELKDPTRPHQLYDSVQGGPHKGWFRTGDKSTIMRVIYSSAQAYPTHLVTFTHLHAP